MTNTHIQQKDEGIALLINGYVSEGNAIYFREYNGTRGGDPRLITLADLPDLLKEIKAKHQNIVRFTLDIAV